MNKSALLLSLLAVACAPIPGLDGRSGPEGEIGPSGSPGTPGATGNDGSDAVAPAAEIAYVVPDRFLAGEEVMVQIVGKFTDWSESAEVVIDYPGVEVVGTQVLSPVTLGVTVRVASNVVSGTADLTIGELSLDSAFAVAPAAWFEFAEGYSNPILPGASVGGTIYLSENFGLPMAEAWSIEILDQRGGFVTDSVEAKGNGLLGYQEVVFEGRVGPQVAAGLQGFAISVNNQVVIPVPGAIEVSDSTAVGLVLNEPATGDLTEGDANFSMNLEEGSILRFVVSGGDFTPTMSLTRPPVEEDERLFTYTNEHEELSAHGQAMELIVPKGGAWYLVLGSTEPLAEDASGAFTLQMETVTVTPTMNRRHVQSLSGPGQGAWFSGPIAEGNLIGWRVSVPEGSETQPIARRYFTGEADGETYVGGLMYASQNPDRWYYRSASELTLFGEQSTRTGQLSWQILDAQLRGGENHDVAFQFVAGANGGATCEDLEGLPIGIPRDELGTVSVLGQLTDEGNDDLGSMSCAPAGGGLVDMVYKLVLTQPRRVKYLVSTAGGESGWRSSWSPMLAIESECANTDTELFCSGSGEGMNFAGEAVESSQSGGSVDLQPGTYVIRVQHEDGMFGEFTLSFWMDLLLEEIPDDQG